MVELGRWMVKSQRWMIENEMDNGWGGWWRVDVYKSIAGCYSLLSHSRVKRK